jgi:hypothetical protein
MQNAQRHGLKKKRYSTNRFNDSEYQRWSEGITATQSRKTQWGIETFLGATKNLQPGREGIPVSSIETDKNEKRAGNEYVLETT